MGMMTRRNVKQRAVVKTSPVNKEIKDDFANVRTYIQPEYTKTDINRMSIADLKELASRNGVDNVEDYTGAELKKILIEKLGL